jgi:hypothetical protein
VAFVDDQIRVTASPTKALSTSDDRVSVGDGSVFPELEDPVELPPDPPPPQEESTNEEIKRSAS